MRLNKACDLRVEDEDHPALPKGHKTARVYRMLQRQPVCSVLQITQHTEIERRTVNAILYSLQGRGLLAPVPTPPGSPENSGRCYSLVDGVTIFATPIVRQVEFKRRSGPKPDRENKALLRQDAVSSLDWQIPDDVPTWFAPRLPSSAQARQRAPQRSTGDLFTVP